MKAAVDVLSDFGLARAVAAAYAVAAWAGLVAVVARGAATTALFLAAALAVGVGSGLLIAGAVIARSLADVDEALRALVENSARPCGAWTEPRTGVRYACALRAGHDGDHVAEGAGHVQWSTSP